MPRSSVTNHLGAGLGRAGRSVRSSGDGGGGRAAAGERSGVGPAAASHRPASVLLQLWGAWWSSLRDKSERDDE